MEYKDKRDNLIYVDHETLEVKVNIRNVLGTYKPNKEVYKILELAGKISKAKEKFLNDFYDPSVSELIQLVHEYNRINNAEYKKMVDEKAEAAKQAQDKKEKGIKKIIKKFFKFKK